MNNNEWISVKDRLPENQQCVLFCTSESVYISVWWYGYKYINGNMAGCYDQDIPLENITHWMPLPNPPSNE